MAVRTAAKRTNWQKRLLLCRALRGRTFRSPKIAVSPLRSRWRKTVESGDHYLYLCNIDKMLADESKKPCLHGTAMPRSLPQKKSDINPITLQIKATGFLSEIGGGFSIGLPVPVAITRRIRSCPRATASTVRSLSASTSAAKTKAASRSAGQLDDLHCHFNRHGGVDSDVSHAAAAAAVRQN